MLAGALLLGRGPAGLVAAVFFLLAGRTYLADRSRVAGIELVNEDR